MQYLNYGKTKLTLSALFTAAALALVILALVKPELFRSKGAAYRSGNMRLQTSSAQAGMTKEAATAKKAVPVQIEMETLIPSQARPAASESVLFREKEAVQDASGKAVQNQVETPYDEMLQQRHNTNFAYVKRLTPQDAPRTVGNQKQAPKVTASVNPTQNSNEQFDAYRKAVLVNPRMIQDKEKNHRRAFENRVGAGAGVYDTVTRMMENAGVFQKPEDVIDCKGIPLLGLDTEHPCYNKFQDDIYKEDHLRIAV